MRLFSSFTATIFFFLFVTFFSTTSVLAAETTSQPWMGRGAGTELDACDLAGRLSGRCYGFDLYDTNLLAFNCKVLPEFGPDKCSNDPARYAQMLKTSTFASIGKTIAAVYENKPTSLALWGKDMGHQIGFLPKPAHAQGIGFSGLQPLLGIWKAMRNIAYGLLACIMVIIGFMIMFRKKIDPKTVVTVQNALPKVVVALILVTFSYAIAALMIDLMYLVMLVGLTILQSASGLTTTGYLTKVANQTLTVGANALGQPDVDLSKGTSLATYYMNSGFWGLFSRTFDPLWQNGWRNSLFNPESWARTVEAFQQGTFGENTARVLGILAKGLGLDLIMGFILRIAYLIAFIRLLFMLISAYINIIVAVITAPIQILMEAFPGSTSFESWIKNLLVNLIPFPITAFFLTLGSWMASELEAGNLWQPPMLPNVGDSTPGLAINLIWVGFVFMIPSIVNGLKESLKAKPAIQAGFGAVLGPIGSGTGQIFQLGYQASFMASPFLHKTPPSTPIERSSGAQKGGFDTLSKGLGTGGPGTH